jgi:hypothetical protein
LSTGEWEAVKNTIDDKQALEANFVHSEADPDPPITLLGALHTLGHTHFAVASPDTTDTDRKAKTTRSNNIHQKPPWPIGGSS